MEKMNNIEFKKIIEELFGFGAQRQFSKFLNRDETTVRRWVSGARSIPPEVPIILAMMQERVIMGYNPKIDVQRFIDDFRANSSLRK